MKKKTDTGKSLNSGRKKNKIKKVFFDSENDGTAARVIDCMLWFADFRLQGAGRGGEGVV